MDQEKFNQAFKLYVERVSKRVKAYYKDFDKLSPESVSTTKGSKFMKVLVGSSVHSFVDRKTGDVYKPASWYTPALHTRGNIFSAFNGDEAMGLGRPEYFINYLN